MPYICLAREDVQGVQILDLSPNASFSLPSEGAAQSAYIQRAQNDLVTVQANGQISEAQADGIRAYLVDKVEPGGREQAAATVTIVGANAGDTVTIGGVVFTCVVGAATAANQEFTDLATAGSASGVATSLAAAVSDAASVTAMKVASVTGTDYVTATTASAVVTLRAVTGAAAVLTGFRGNLITLATSASARFTLSAARLTRLVETWAAATLTATVTALQARVDAGQSLALTDINTILNANATADLTGTNNQSRSVGTVSGLLSVLAGRGYRIKRLDANGTPHQFMATENPTFEWDVPEYGSFTEAVLVQGTGMTQGEIKPTAIGGDTVQREIRPIRTFADNDSFKISAALGTLATFSAAEGAPPVTLWPDSDVVPHFPWSMQPAVNASYSETSNARLVTVYNADGSLYV